ncbi:hypothetical protein BDV18DRAFT_155915 [Aspergillus unguis]
MDHSLDGPTPKRIKVRRGTRSCWECKRRKMKCVFERPDDAVCVGCHRRWTQCVSQEFPEQVSSQAESTRKIRDRLRLVESRLEQVLQDTPSVGRHEPTSSHTAVVGVDSTSEALYKALPLLGDTARIAKASSDHSVPFHEILTTPYSILDRDGLRAHSPMLSIEGPNVHPVLIARHMLHLASFLQHLHPDLHPEIQGLSEPPSVLRDRLADTAIRLVITRDEFVGSVEFLECIMVQSLYEANCGHLRHSWLTARRAMAIAQSMGFHQSGARLQYQVLHPDTKAYPRFMWFRIVFYDRQMCLLLGMPEGSLDRTMGADAMLAQDTPVGRLERQHCVIMSRLLERNNTDPTCSDYSITQQLDADLHRIARILPSKWWLTPNLNGKQKPDALFWDMRQLSAQLCHYNLLNQIHLPYLLRPSPPDDNHKYDYSQITCVTSSREILTRFIMLRRWNCIAFSCRTIDFIALMAGMTLLLAHLVRYHHRHPQVDHFLAAQALGDRAMVEQVQEHMEEVDRLNADPLSAKSARFLRRLLDLEGRAAEGDLDSARGVCVQSAGATSEPEPEDYAGANAGVSAPCEDDKRVYIPYFGVIQAATEIVAARGSPTTSTDMIRQRQGPIQAQIVPLAENTNSNIFAPLVGEVLSDDPMQLFEYPGMTAADDGTFQDIDLAFLDNLMRGTGTDGRAEGD